MRSREELFGKKPVARPAEKSLTKVCTQKWDDVKRPEKVVKGVSGIPVVVSILLLPVSFVITKFVECAECVMKPDSSIPFTSIIEKMFSTFDIHISGDHVVPFSAILVLVTAIIYGYTIIHGTKRWKLMTIFTLLFLSDSYVIHSVMNSTAVGLQVLVFSLALYTIHMAGTDMSIHIFSCCAIAFLLCQRIEVIWLIPASAIMVFGQRGWVLSLAGVVLAVIIPALALLAMNTVSELPKFTNEVMINDIWQVLRKSEPGAKTNMKFSEYQLWIIASVLYGFMKGSFEKNGFLFVLACILAIIVLLYAPLVVESDGVAYSVLLVRILAMTVVGYLGCSVNRVDEKYLLYVALPIVAVRIGFLIL